MQNVRVRFAYKEGFRRLWLVLSIAWVVLVSFMFTRYEHVETLYACLLLITPPAFLYLVGAAAVWIIEGFAKPDQ